MITNIFIWMMFGLITGWIWSLLQIEESTNKPAVPNIVTSVASAVVGGYIIQPYYIGQDVSGISTIGIIGAVAFALIALAMFKLLGKLFTLNKTH